MLLLDTAEHVIEIQAAEYVYCAHVDMVVVPTHCSQLEILANTLSFTAALSFQHISLPLFVQGSYQFLNRSTFLLC